MDEKNLKIVVLDSGINLDYSCFHDMPGRRLYINSAHMILEGTYADEIGHGTAVSFIIHKHLPLAHIISFKIFSENAYDADNLILALNYIDENIDCNIINISLGITCSGNLSELKSVCDRLTNKGVLIISAFDNSGICSYPAAFQNVIGVDISNTIKKLFDYEFVENSIVNIRGYSKEQNLPWLNGKYMTVSGASFTAPYISVIVGRLLISGINGFSAILERLKSGAAKILHYETIAPAKEMPLKKGIFFPFNKEMHSIARFENMLSVDVEGFYDVKYIGNIGRKTSEVIGEVYGHDYIIENYLNINWESSFDSVILGHTLDLSRITNINFEKYFIEKCVQYKKSLYSFAEIQEELTSKLSGSHIPWFYPTVNPEDVPKGTFGKLKRISKPVVAVVGTSQRQGKFTLQLKLKMIFENSGYKVGMLGTEPSSKLLGADEIYPMGFETTVHTTEYDSIMYINNLMGKIENKEPDLILVGSQSQTVPITDGWIGFYPIKQHEFLLACAPDCYILCINVSDDLQYIKRTINYLENILPSKVICLALFPFDMLNKWSVIGTAKSVVSEDVINHKISELRKRLKKKVYNLLDEKTIYKIANDCISYFQ